MRKVKILLLSSIQPIASNIRNELAKRGVEVEFVPNILFGRDEVYNSSPAICRMVTDLTSRGEVDLVVIANNLGAGIEKARAVAENMRDKTIVFWTGDFGTDNVPYKQLGITRFGMTATIQESVAEALALTAPASVH